MSTSCFENLLLATALEKLKCEACGRPLDGSLEESLEQAVEEGVDDDGDPCLLCEGCYNALVKLGFIVNSKEANASQT